MAGVHVAAAGHENRDVLIERALVCVRQTA